MQKYTALTIPLIVVSLSWIPGCESKGQIFRLTQERDTLRTKNEQLSRELEARRQMITRQQIQIDQLKLFAHDRPGDLFAPAKIEILSRSGGTSWDDRPGDEGVTVYIRPVDRDGSAVKTPGEIRVRVLDNTDLEKPVVLCLCEYDDPNELRRMWYSHFGTYHYTAKCRFSSGRKAPRSGKVLVSVEFLDYLTGQTLTASKELVVLPVP